MNYADITTTATRLITAYGQACTLTKLTAGTFDGVLGVYSGQTTTNYTVNAVIDEYKNSFIDGSLVKMGDKKAYIESATQPEIDNSLTVGTVVHKIVNVKTINPGGTVVLYEAQLRI